MKRIRTFSSLILIVLLMLSIAIAATEKEIKTGTGIEKEAESASTDRTNIPIISSGDIYEITEPPYAWIDGITNGIEGPTGDDVASGAINIGFQFPFYGNVYSQLWFNTNGLITFDGPTSTYSNTYIPNPNLPNNFIAPYWDDLYVDGTARTYYKLDSSSSPKKFIITWYDIRRYAGTTRTTLEAVLYEDGKILFQYKKPSIFENSNSATIGIEDKWGGEGELYRYNEPPADYSAVMLDPTTKVRWSSVGATGIVDESDLNIFQFSGPEVFFRSSASLPADIDLRYNVIAVDGLLRGNDAKLMVRYRDNGANARVLIELKRYNLNTGIEDTWISFDSNDYPQSNNYQTWTINSCGGEFDFENNAYYIRAKLYKSASTGNPGLSGIQLWEKMESSIGCAFPDARGTLPESRIVEEDEEVAEKDI